MEIELLLNCTQGDQSSQARGGRRPYESPCLIQWGSLTALTRGPISGLDDLPLDGGTSVE